jgi:hypothetical protein
MGSVVGYAPPQLNNVSPQLSATKAIDSATPHLAALPDVVARTFS